jgi:hypothetical protein
VCLTISAEIRGADEQRLKDIIRGWPESGLAFGAEGKGLLGRHSARLAFHACDLLSDDADWNAPSWAMTPESIVVLADLWGRLFERVSGEVVAQALWDGDRPEVEQTLSRAAFMDVVAQGALGTKTRYLVKP